MRQLLEDDAIFKTSLTRAVRYFPRKSDLPEGRVKRILDLSGLDEFDDIAIALTLPRLRDNVESIVRYAFAEALCNAVDYSMDDQCVVEMRLSTTRLFRRVQTT